jgi:prophage tail gpP-like protein
MAADHDDGDLTLTIGGRNLGGWTNVAVSMGIEIMPSSFEVAMTERYPGEADALTVQPGDSCLVHIGNDTVITGYVDVGAPRIRSRSHVIRVVGRSKSADLVDCSAEWPGGQITGSSALEIAKKLCTPYGIEVEATADVGAPIPQFNLTIGESPYEIIERICRYRALLFYDLPNGNVTLSQVGKGKMASGLVEGGNLEDLEAIYSMAERFSDYEAFLQSVDTLQDAGNAGNLLAHYQDAGVTRHRLKTIIAEAGGGGLDVAKKRAVWEMNRRAGRAYRLDATVDSWRDVDGRLWTPNYEIPVTAPSCKVPAYDWLIGRVLFRRSEDDGTHADLEVMPAKAFSPEPILLQPFPPDVAQALGQR